MIIKKAEKQINNNKPIILQTNGITELTIELGSNLKDGYFAFKF